MSMRRRSFLTSVFPLAAIAGLTLGDRKAMARGGLKNSGLVKIIEFTDSGERKGVMEVEKIHKTDEEWKKQLTPEQYEVTRHAGTERAFSGKYWNNHEHGIYRCVCCGNALFSSETKFDSRTGWPSFWEPIAKQNVQNHTDLTYGMARTEVRCAKCDAHLGHVFEDAHKFGNLTSDSNT